MTEKQAEGLRTAITGAALFIGGAILPVHGSQWGEISMLAGLLLMFGEPVGKIFFRWFQSLGDNQTVRKEGEEHKNESD